MVRLFNIVPRSWITAIHDIVVSAISFVLALYLRLGDNMLPHLGIYVDAPIEYLFYTAILFSLIFTGFAIGFRLHRSVWRYVSTVELVNIARTALFSIILFYAALFLYNRLDELPRSVPFIHLMLLLMLLSAPRIGYRLLKEQHSLGSLLMGLFSLNKTALREGLNSNPIEVIVVGYKGNAEQFLKASQSSGEELYKVIAIIDDDRKQHGRHIHNIPIIGSSDELSLVVNKLRLKGYSPQRVILSEDYIDSDIVSELLSECETLGLTLARLPRLTDFRSSDIAATHIRPIAVEDLLGRPQNFQDRKELDSFIGGKVVLVTGAGGSIGSEICRQIARHKPKKMLLLDSSEHNLYMIDYELGEKAAHLDKKAIIADVRDTSHIDYIFRCNRPDIVFHAAAIKHVPLAEENIEAAVTTNVFGTVNIANSSRRYGAGTMVMISTDKAVNPTNVMGACKRLAESYCQAFASSSNDMDTKFITVRFGNVLGSNGSVVPLFKRQVESGGPVTVTHPDIERYFMTIREAVGLVLQSAIMGTNDTENNGLIYVLDMGKPVKIKFLAEQVIRLAGLRPYEDIKIVYTGLRAGEKLYEELFHDAEALQETSHKSIMLASPRQMALERIVDGLKRLKASCDAKDTKTTIKILKELVPESSLSSPPVCS